MKKVLLYLNQTKIQIIILILLTGLVYSNSLGNGLVWDDHLFLEQWPDIQSFSGLESILKGSAPPAQDKIFRPVRGIIYMVNYSLWGNSAFFYHFQALLIHLASTILIYLIAIVIFQKVLPQSLNKLGNLNLPKLGAFFAGLIFGVHPIHTETINYISTSMETWGSLFFFLSFYFYILCHSRKSGKLLIYGFRIKSSMAMYLISIIFAFLAFFTYEMTLTLPFLIILYDLVFNKDEFKKNNLKALIIKWLPYFLAAGIFIFIRVVLLNITSRTDYLAYSFYLTQLVMVKVFIRYILLLLWPVNQTAIHNLVGDFPSSMISYDSLEPIVNQTIFDPDVLISIVVIVMLLIFSIKYIKRYPLPSFSILWFFISLLPVSYIIPHGGAMAEKYLYIPSVGFCLLVVFILFQLLIWISKLKSKSNNLIFLVFSFFILLIAFYSVLTFFRNPVWKNDITLFSDVVKKSPGNLIANYTLAIWLVNGNLLKQAETHYKIALEKAPEFAEARFNLANLYLRMGDFDQAGQEYNTLLKSYPGFTPAKNSLANIELLRESTKSGVINGAVMVNYEDPLGFEFLFPAQWGLSKKQEKVILKEPSDQLTIELFKPEIEPGDINKYILEESLPKARLINQGPALIPGFDEALAKVWQIENAQTLEFFLIKNDSLIQVRVYPANSNLMGEFDKILGSIKLN